MKKLLNRVINQNKNFESDKQKNDYSNEIANIYNKNTFRGVFLTIILYSIFNTLDYLIYSNYFYILFIMRFVFTILAFILLFFLKKERALNNYKLMGALWILLMIIPICLMIYITEGSISPYYAGLLLTIVGFCQFLPLTSIEAFKYCLITILFYIIVVMANNTMPFDFAIFYNNILFIVSISIINITTCYFFTNLRVEEFKKRYELKEINRQKTEYYAKVNHEIRTPLAMIISPLERLIDENDKLTGEKKIYLLNVARNNSLRLLGLANDLLEMVRLEQAQTRDKRAIDLSFIIGGIVRAVEYMFAEQGHIFNYVKPDAPILIKGNYKSIEKIVYNLLSNASKFTPKGGNVTVKLTSNKDNAQMIVSDTGIGISPDHRAFIFEEFKQADGEEVRRSKGLGLGLAIVKRVVEELGGTVEVNSRLNAGSDFIVSLPLFKDDTDIIKIENNRDNLYDGSLLTDAADRAEAYKIITPQTLKEISAGIKTEYTMLIIDDEQDMNNSLAEIFKAEYRILQAESGKEGIKKAIKNKPDIILSDLMLPDLNGLDVCRKLREQESLQDTKIIVITARGEEEIRVDVIAAGANDFIGKPFSNIEIKVRIDRIKKDIKRNKELQKALEKLKQAQVTLVRDEKIKTLGVLSAGILHEIHNSLNSIRPFVVLLREDFPREMNENPRIKESIDSIFQVISDIQEITDGIRIFSSGAEKYKAYFLLNEILKRAQDIIKKKADNIIIKNNIKTNPEIYGSSTEIFNLFLNLFINSIYALGKVNRKEPTIEISAYEKNKRLYIRFKDNGCGIKPENIDKVFEAFYTNKEAKDGTGLGLSIVEATIKEHGGEIKVNSKEGEWTEFVFDLPLEMELLTCHFEEQSEEKSLNKETGQ